MRSGKRHSLGQLGESAAADYLCKKGYTILARNCRTPYGEIDIIALCEGELIFVEVKTRASTSLGPPEISITPRKQKHMRDSAEHYIQNNASTATDWRIDLITVRINPGNTPPVIDHFENVIQ